ncbi:MAG: putative bifunctional diguanylate cyclase/phosphodiesterase [Spirochaetaceae bacterium]
MKGIPGLTSDTENTTGPPDNASGFGSVAGGSEAEQLRRENAELRRQLHESEEQRMWLRELVNKNPHTGLPIRRVFDKQIGSLLEGQQGSNGRDARTVVGVVRLDRSYDRIKDTRDRGKALLFNTADRLQRLVGDHLYQSDRLDEFIFAVNGLPGRDAAELLGRRIMETIARPHEPPAKDVSFGCRVGLSLDSGGLSKEELLGNAYIALSQAETDGARVVVYDESIGNLYRENLELERSLHSVSRDGFDQFRLMYQPFAAADGRIVGAEALIRWFHPRLGPVSPARFIPIAEETGAIRLLGQWTLYNAARQLRDWSRISGRELHMSVNLSPAQFKQQDLVTRIEGILEALALGGDSLKLELTEGAIMEDPEEAARKMAMLHDRGIRISIDDFGTGYSSLSYLKRFPVDTLKIDRSFIEDVTTNPSNQEIVRAIISMAKSLRIESLAEGVETVEQRNFLVAEGCDVIQGYLYSPPVPARDFEPFLVTGRIDPGTSIVS